jgi:hypothetical protein
MGEFGPSLPTRKAQSRISSNLFRVARNQVGHDEIVSPNLWSDARHVEVFEWWRRPHNLPCVRLPRTVRSRNNTAPTSLIFGGMP